MNVDVSQCQKTVFRMTDKSLGQFSTWATQSRIVGNRPASRKENLEKMARKISFSGTGKLLALWKTQEIE
jgi:hypothetical protein